MSESGKHNIKNEKPKNEKRLNSIDQVTTQALELNDILSLYAHHAQTSAGRETILHPSLLTKDSMAVHFEQLARWIDYLEGMDPIPIPTLPPGNSFSRHPYDHPLKREELKSFRDALAFILPFMKPDQDFGLIPSTTLKTMAEDFALDEIYQFLDHAFDPSGHWSPNLTPKFSQLSAEETRLGKRLEHLLLDRLNHLEGKLTENVIFERNGRKVIAVQKSFKRSVPGILQDYSTSGQTAFIEPDTSTPLQNRLQEIIFEKEEEVFRFRVQATTQIQEHADSLQKALAMITTMDVLQALSLMARQTRSCPIVPNQEGLLVLVNARHPFLDQEFAQLREVHFNKTDKNRMVPLSLTMGEDQIGFIISGANAGGKTVTIKTVGLLACLANFGFPIPVDSESQIPDYDFIFADIGDHQSLSHNLSTYASHLHAMKRVLTYPHDNSLVLLDELGSGTDPQEGNALAQALIEAFLQEKVHLFITTHQQVLCSFALNEPKLINASMSFDKNRLIPTYQFVQGVPGRSHALEIAERTGLPEKVLVRAKRLLDDHQIDIQEAIIRLQDQTRAMEKQKARFRKEERRAQRRIAETKKEQEHLLAMQEDLKQSEKGRIQSKVQQMEKEFRKFLKKVESRKTRQKLAQEFSTVQEEIAGPQEPEKPNMEGTPSGLPMDQWKPGDSVFIKSWHRNGTLESTSRNQVRVKLGGMPVSLHIDDIIHLGTGKDRKPKKNKVMIDTGTIESTFVPFEIKLLGMSKEEALDQLRKTLDAAFVNHPALLKIVHGHGHGILKKAIREFLDTHPLRSHWESQIDPDNDGTTDLHFRW